MVGNRKPLLRSVDSGNDTHGRYMSGTPMKSIWASRAVPILARVSSTMLSALICHDSSRSGQVVKITPLRRSTPCGVSCICCAAPRAGRWRSENCAERELRAAAGRIAAARAAHLHQRIAVVDVAVGCHRAVAPIELRLVGMDHPLALAHLDVALERRLAGVLRDFGVHRIRGHLDLAVRRGVDACCAAAGGGGRQQCCHTGAARRRRRCAL